jgi:co-chaperonin GroES (HSP10)
VIRPTADNVLIVLEPEEETTPGGLYMAPRNGPKPRYSRIAKVLAVGPGHYGRTSYKHPEGCWHPTTLRPGDRVIVDHLCGQDYRLDLTVPRHNKGAQFMNLLGQDGEFRIIREDEALAVVEKSSNPEIKAAEADTGDC